MHDAISLWCDFLCEKSTVSCWFGHDHKPDQVQIWHGYLPLGTWHFHDCLSRVVHAHLKATLFPATTHNLDNLTIQKKSLIDHTYTVYAASRGEGSDLGDVGERPSVEACREVCAQSILCTMAQCWGGSPGLKAGWMLELVVFFYPLIWQVDVGAWCESSCESSGYPTVITTVTPKSLSKHFMLYKKRNMCTASRCMYILYHYGCHPKQMQPMHHWSIFWFPPLKAVLDWQLGGTSKTFSRQPCHPLSEWGNTSLMVQLRTDHVKLDLVPGFMVADGGWHFQPNYLVEAAYQSVTSLLFQVKIKLPTNKQLVAGRLALEVKRIDINGTKPFPCFRRKTFRR